MADEPTADEPKPKDKPLSGTTKAIIGAVVIGLTYGVLYLSCLNHGKSRAKDNFSGTFTCPSDKIEMRERDDIKGSMFNRHEEPSAEIKADPSRLAMFKKKQAEADAQADSGGNYGVYYWEVRGCGHEALYECSNKPSCHDRTFPAGIKPSW